MATSASSSSTPRCATTPEDSVAARFGDVSAFGPFIEHALERHIKRERAVDDLPVAAEPPSVAALAAALDQDVDVLEAAASKYELRELSQGTTASGEQGGASTRDRLKAIIERCGGLKQLDAAIYELVEHVQSKVAGGLRHNRFQIGFWSDGTRRACDEWWHGERSGLSGLLGYHAMRLGERSTTVPLG